MACLNISNLIVPCNKSIHGNMSAQNHNQGPIDITPTNVRSLNNKEG